MHIVMDFNDLLAWILLGGITVIALGFCLGAIIIDWYHKLLNKIMNIFKRNKKED